MSVPVVSAGGEVIVGFNERRLTEVLGLGIVPSADGTDWLATRYVLVFDALTDATRRLGQARMETPFTKRRMTVRAHVLHIVSFAEGGWRTHDRGTFNFDDMRAATARCESITSVDAICEYADRVRDDISTYLHTAEASGLGRIVSSHYGGEVPVLEVMQIMLRHSAHHLRQLGWLMRTELSIDMDSEIASAVAGITVPAELFDR